MLFLGLLVLFKSVKGGVRECCHFIIIGLKIKEM